MSDESRSLGQDADLGWKRWARFGLSALRIAASTIALVELLRSDWLGGLSATLAWLAFVQAERGWSQKAPSNGGVRG